MSDLYVVSVMLAFHDADTDTDTEALEEIACVGRKIVAVFGESVSVSVSVSASWNASLMQHISVYHINANLQIISFTKLY